MSDVRTLHLAEPPAQYLLRQPIVVDCSVLIGALFSEHWQSLAEQQIKGRELHAPYLLQAEFANAVVKKTRHGLAELAHDALARLNDLEIDLHRMVETAVVALALRYQLSGYDASYLWLAADLKCPLVTFDEKLATAAKAHLSSLS